MLFDFHFTPDYLTNKKLKISPLDLKPCTVVSLVAFNIVFFIFICNKQALCGLTPMCYIL